MSTDRQADCIDALRKIAQETPVLQLTQNGYFYADAGGAKGYVDIEFLRSNEADTLQRRVVQTFNELRAGMRERDKAKMTKATGLTLENFQKYGYPAIGELFRPHITLAKFPAETTPDLSALPNPANFTGRFTRLGLFEMGANGTCIRKIAEYNLR